MKAYAVIFTDKLNQYIHGGSYFTFIEALLIARSITERGVKSTWQIIRLSDGVKLAQSKAAQS